MGSPLLAVKLPLNWPPSIRYLKRPILSKALSAEKLAEIRLDHSRAKDTALNALTEVQAVSPSPCPVEIRAINDRNHPAFGQHGLFATRQLEPSSFILVYLGYVHDEAETNPASDYDLSLDREHGISVDASSMGNEARFINDYRGIRQEGPNAEFRDCWLSIKGSGAVPEVTYQKCIGVYVLSEGKSGKRKGGIAQNDEILVNYGKGFWRERAVSKREQESNEQNNQI